MRPLVILPTYNERENLPQLAARLLAIPDLRVLVVDDASPDGTGAIADDLAKASDGRLSVLHRRGPRGLGLSYIDGMHRAFERDATHICQMDADLSHDPADLPRLLAATSEADMAIGSRYVPGGRIENWPRRRLLLSGFANWYVRTVTGLRISDCTSGFRCWRTDALRQIPLSGIASDGYAFLVELLWHAAASRLRIVEVPITFVERRLGASKMSAQVMWESAFVPWRVRARSRPD